ncbi:DNA-binding protein [Paraburkholderia sp. BR14263]|uniref:DNA-binding protein n=1 Tax=unclassified Paraburkholderia TaxID=2615204 RepID=UPI0034CEF1E5
MTLRTAEEARAELNRKGVSITKWALANKFSPALVYEVLSGRKKATRGQSHDIAVKLGLKAGEVCTDPTTALAR